MAQQQLVFRPRTAADDRFILGLARRSFARWSRDPERTVASMLAPSARVEVASSSADEDPLGFAVVTFAPLRRPSGPWQARGVARLDAIAVTLSARKQGVGFALVERAEAIGHELGAAVITLMTAESNKRARRLFERAGFLSVVRLPEAYANGEASIEMFKPLAELPARSADRG